MNRTNLIFNEILPNSTGLEIGVWKGDFSEEILINKKPKLLYLLDPWEFFPEYPDRWYGGTSANSQKDMDEIYNNVVSRFKNFNNIKILRIKSKDVLQYINENTLDWVYIDGNHSYDFVLSDLNISFILLKNNGYILGDDYGEEVKDAVLTFCKNNNMFIKYVINRESQYLIKVIK
jgi:hypothetical protein